MVIEVDGQRLTTGEIVAAAYRRAPVVLTSEGRRRAERSHTFAEQISRERPVYGRSTGVGANRDVAVADGVVHARALLHSHATSAGPVRSSERVRAMLVVRLNQLAAGGGGATPALLDALAAMISADALPVVREYGSIGTGDLTALATTALALAGAAPTSTPLPSLFEFGAHDALSFMSSNAAAIGDAALACADLQVLARASVVVAALTFTAVDGNGEAFSPAVERVTPFDGARRVCGWMRALTDGAARPARIQDPFGLRTFPQAHGPALDSLTQLDDVVCRFANAPSENPVLLAGTGRGGELAHHGGFNAAYLTTALQTAVPAITQSAKLNLARLTTLTDSDFTRLPAFLGDGTPGASGVMIVEYVAASALADLRVAAAPSGLQTVVLSRGVEEDATFASQAARQAAAAVPSLRVLVGCELLAASRALRARSLAPTNDLLVRVHQICDGLPGDLSDRDLTADLELAQGMLPALASVLDAT